MNDHKFLMNNIFEQFVYIRGYSCSKQNNFNFSIFQFFNSYEALENHHSVHHHCAHRRRQLVPHPIVSVVLKEISIIDKNFS